MRPVYAVQFDVRGQDGGDIDQLHHRVKAAVANWVRRWYERRDAPAPDIPVDGGRAQPADLHQIAVMSAAASSGERLWELVWSYPSEQDHNLLWGSTCLVAQAQQELSVSLVLRISSRQFTLTPASFELRRPYLVKVLIETLPCYLGQRQLHASAQLIGVEDIASFVDELLDPERHLPIIVFSRDPFSERYLASPARAADALAGLAHVYMLNDRWACFALTDAVGRSLSCYNGAVRLYWPVSTETCPRSTGYSSPIACASWTWTTPDSQPIC